VNTQRLLLRRWITLQSRISFTLFILNLLANSWGLHAQPTDVKFDHLTVNQGLSFNWVTAIMQDSRGFMWFATANGLNKYDGYSFTMYKADPLDSESLSGSWINLLYEDTHGDLWITTGGLNRFDRVTGRISRHLSDRHITSICEDSSAEARENGMWFTTLGQGVYQYIRTTNRFTEYRHNPSDSNSISSDSTFCASVDVEGTLWIGTANGLNSLDKSRRKFAHLDHGPKGHVYTLYQDPDEPSRLLWIGANDGLYLYDKAGGSFSHYRNDFGNPNGPEDTRDSFSQYWNDLGNPNRPEDNDVRTVYRDWKGRLWVGMFAEGLNGGLGGIARFDRSTRRFTSYQGGLYGNAWGNVGQPWTICEDRTGTMWMVFSHWGYLRKYDEMRNEWTRVPVNADHDVPFDALCEDRSGTMWFGTVADAVLKLDRTSKQFSVYSKDPGDGSGLSSGVVTGIYEDASGSVWVGTMSGLNRLNASTGKFTHYRHDNRNPHSLSIDRIWPILEDRKGRLWIGTWGGGLDEFDKTRQRFVHHRNSPGDSLSLPWDGVDALCESRDGTLWVGTDDANISEYSPGSNIFRRHFPGNRKSGGTGYELDAILEDHTGHIWIAVPGAGLYSYDRTSDTWTKFMLDPNAGNESKRIGSIVPLALYEDRRETIWVGTNVGLFRIDRQTVTCVPVSGKEGFSDNYIRAILEDGEGCLWLCTLNGLSRFNPQTGSVRNFDASDGVTIGPCTLPTGYKNKKGEMFFGGSSGLVRFHPDSIKDNPFVPPLVITAFKKFDKVVSLDSAISERHSIELSYKENVFSFEFASLNYTSPEKNQYAYKLEGFDKEWTYCGTRRYATYTNLDGGSYTFRVKGSNNDGVWNEQGTSIVVIIASPWWKTTWAYLFYGLVGIGALYGIRRFQINRLLARHKLEMTQVEARTLREEDKRKSRFFANISHEFRTPLTLILGPTEELQGVLPDESSREKLSMVHRNAQRLLRLINQLLDLSKIDAGGMKLQAAPGNIVPFVKGIAQSFQSSAEGKSIALHVEADNEEIEIYFDQDKMEKILTNLLSNAFKFTPERGAVTVRIQSSSPVPADSLEIIVSDTGVGIPEEELSHIFDRFYQVDASQTREQEGTGIGLALAKELVELHRGTISVTSVVGKGTEFRVRIPLGSAHLKADEILAAQAEIGERSPVHIEAHEQSAQVDPGVQTPDGTRSIVLVVEDNIDVRAYIRQYLVPSYQVLEAHDGKEGVEKARESIPDLIISDVMMPKLDGYELCKTLKLDEKTSHVPIILLTAKAGQENKVEGLETGADDYLTKPFDAKELLVRVKNLIEVRRKLRERFSAAQVLKPGEIAVTSIDDAFLQKALAVVEKRLGDENFSVEDFAREAGMSRSQLHRKLTALTNQSPGSFIRYMRLHRAMELLRKNAGTVSEIAYAVGFSGLSYFTQCFQEQFSVLPSEVKKS